MRLAVLLWLWAAAAAATPDPDTVQIKRSLREATTARIAGVALSQPARLQRFYAGRAYRPAWLDHGGRPLPAAAELTATVTAAAEHGLRPQHYHAARLAAELRSLRIAFAASARQRADVDLLLSDAFLGYGLDLARGRVDPRRLDPNWPFRRRKVAIVAALRDALANDAVGPTLAALAPAGADYARLRAALARYRALNTSSPDWPPFAGGPKLKPGAVDPRLPALRERLRLSGDYRPADSADPLLYDPQLAAAVRRFQARHGIKADAVVGLRTRAALNRNPEATTRLLALNLERLRWRPDELGDHYVLVNIAGFDLGVYQRGRRVLSSGAVVGRAAHPTPLLSSKIDHLVLSPYWHVPHRIAVEDKLPLLREDPAGMIEQGFRLFAGEREINPLRVNWQRIRPDNFRYLLRQDPGPANALGQVKFMFPNNHSVYIHDTASEVLFGRSLRPYSSGCVRIEQPFALAEHLLAADPRWDRTALEQAGTRDRPRRVNLRRPVAVHFLYWTAWVDDAGVLQLRKDIYKRDPPLAAALSRR